MKDSQPFLRTRQQDTDKMFDFYKRNPWVFKSACLAARCQTSWSRIIGPGVKSVCLIALLFLCIPVYPQHACALSIQLTAVYFVSSQFGNRKRNRCQWEVHQRALVLTWCFTSLCVSVKHGCHKSTVSRDQRYAWGTSKLIGELPGCCLLCTLFVFWLRACGWVIEGEGGGSATTSGVFLVGLIYANWK